jgi:malonyl-CoA/methylmalonyl-CoA synthetase
VELAIDSLDGIDESAVIGLADRDFGEAVTAVVKRLAGHDALTGESIIAALKTDMAAYKVPKTVHFVDELPRNSMGKVQKNQLREQFGSAEC